MNPKSSGAEAVPLDIESSSEWSALGRELFLADPEIHQQAIEAVRLIASGLRKRRAHCRMYALPIFGGHKRKASA